MLDDTADSEYPCSPDHISRKDSGQAGGTLALLRALNYGLYWPMVTPDSLNLIFERPAIWESRNSLNNPVNSLSIGLAAPRAYASRLYRSCNSTVSPRGCRKILKQKYMLINEHPLFNRTIICWYKCHERVT